MTNEKTHKENNKYYIGIERRHALNPRRKSADERRHRTRAESLVSDCRKEKVRRDENEEGFYEIPNLYEKTEDDNKNLGTKKII